MTADTTKIPDGHALVAPWRAGSLSPALRPPWPSGDSPGPEEENLEKEILKIALNSLPPGSRPGVQD